MPRKLNPKQRKVVKLVAEGKSQTQAYKDVYGVKDDNVAAASATKMLRKAKIGSELERVLRKEGLDESSIAGTLKKLVKHRDWRANVEGVDRIARFTGYGEDKTQVNVQTNLKVDFIKDE